MPELPEVETVRLGLRSHVVGRRIGSVRVLHDRAVRRHPGGAEDFQRLLAGRIVTDVRRRGKYLWWALDDGDAVLAHLGMSGQFRVGAPPPAGAGAAGVGLGSAGAEHPHLRIRFTFDDAGPALDFLDQRTFGGMTFAPGGADLPAAIAVGLTGVAALLGIWTGGLPLALVLTALMTGVIWLLLRRIFGANRGEVRRWTRDINDN